VHHRLGLAGIDALHALAAPGTVQAPLCLGPGQFFRIDQLHLAEIGYPLGGGNHLRRHAIGRLRLSLQPLQLRLRERVRPLGRFRDTLFQRPAAEVIVDCRGRPFSVGNRVDHAGRTDHHVAAGKDALARGGHRQFVRFDGSPARCSQVEQFGQLPIGRLAHGRDQHVGLDGELGAGHGHGSPAAAFVRLAQFHANALHGGKVALPADDLHRRGQVVDLHAFLDRRLDLLFVRRHLAAGTAIDDGHHLGALAHGGSGGVDGRVAAADNHHPVARRDRLAQAEFPQVIDAVDHAPAIFARDIELAAVMGSGGHEQGVEFLFELLGRDVLAHGGARPERHAQRLDGVQIPLEDLRREAVIGNSHGQHAAQHGKRFEDGDLMARAGQTAGYRDTHPAPPV